MALQQEVEDLWRGKLAQAWARYENAKAKCQVLDVSPVRALALNAAQQEEAVALREYIGVLRIITDFVVRGHMLPED